MDSEEVREQLGIGRERLTSLIDRGMPWHGDPGAKQFDEREVKIWLIEQGLAEPTRRIVKTQRAIADHFGRDLSTIRNWKRDPDFPKLASGHYDLDAVEEWLRRRDERNGRKKESQAHHVVTGEESLSIQDQIRKLKLEKELGQLVSLDEVKREMVRTHNYAVSELHNVAAKVESRLPGDLRPEVISMIREAIVSSVDEAIAIINEMIESNSEGVVA